MKALQLLMMIGGLMVASSGILMVITNPSKHDYEVYATDALSFYLKERVCSQAPSGFGTVVQSYCKTLVDTGRPQIKKIISTATTQHNFLLFSIYETELSLPPLVPTYQFQTIGVMQNFYTYEAQKL